MFDNEEFSNQMLQMMFLDDLLSWSKLYVVEAPVPLLIFIN